MSGRSRQVPPTATRRRPANQHSGASLTAIGWATRSWASWLSSFAADSHDSRQHIRFERLLFAELCVGRRRRMNNESLRVADVDQMAGEVHRLDESLADC